MLQVRVLIANSRMTDGPGLLGRRVRAQVISDYRTAKALLPDMGRSSQGGVWHNLVQEVEKVLPMWLPFPDLGMT